MLHKPCYIANSFIASYILFFDTCSCVKDKPKIQSDDVEADGIGQSTHWRKNCTRIGYVVYTVS